MYVTIKKYGVNEPDYNQIRFFTAKEYEVVRQFPSSTIRWMEWMTYKNVYKIVKFIKSYYCLTTFLSGINWFWLKLWFGEQPIQKCSCLKNFWNFHIFTPIIKNQKKHKKTKKTNKKKRLWSQSSVSFYWKTHSFESSKLWRS